MRLIDKLSCLFIIQILLLTVYHSIINKNYPHKKLYNYTFTVDTYNNFDINKDIEDIHTVDQALEYAHEYIRYTPDKEIHGVEEYWQLPEETMFLKTGDCDDYAIFLLYILKEKLGIDCELITVKRKNTPVYHALVHITTDRYRRFLDPTNWSYRRFGELLKKYRFCSVIPYENTVYMTFMYHKQKGRFKFH